MYCGRNYHTNLSACLKKGYSSNVIGILAHIQFDVGKTRDFLYYTCIKKCLKTKGCVAITFKEQGEECWLKSSESHAPKKERTFLVLKCLKQPGHTLYDGFKGFTSDGRAKYADYTCPKQYKDWISSSFYCYNLFVDSPQRHSLDANNLCKSRSQGQLAQIDSQKLFDIFASEIASINGGHPIFIGWQLSKYS